ncbi:MAG: hypothetical protein JWR12_240 [Mucilaginibacter sp.]|jgi:hypothetical protein|nr:hypothetical protein [Mucilaginibacter sp.]
MIMCDFLYVLKIDYELSHKFANLQFSELNIKGND